MTILQDQIDYYRARAAEYDEWFYRKGRYDHGEVLNKQWFDEVAVVEEHLARTMNGVSSVLEMAGGTGIWTEKLAASATQVMVLDASPEMIAINRAKVNSDNVVYQQVDLFTWQPQQQYDMVFFSFWLSHVPTEKVESFLNTVAKAVRPKGKLFIMDSLRTLKSTAKDHVLPEAQSVKMTRKLNDGREFSIIKVFYEIQTLRPLLENAGFIPDVKATENFFIHASATRS